jgi:hypothetical protein
MYSNSPPIFTPVSSFGENIFFREFAMVGKFKIGLIDHTWRCRWVLQLPAAGDGSADFTVAQTLLTA